jgi:hypothetical protein
MSIEIAEGEKMIGYEDIRYTHGQLVYSMGLNKKNPE